MQFSASLFYVLSLLAISVSSEREQEFATARIFLHKSTTSKFPLVVGSDFVVSYVVSNNGEASATDLTLTDRYDPSSFELIENVSVNGSVSFSVKELAPGALVSISLLSSHSQKLIILQPREFELSST
jgi:Translocon-associated protein beta (TRAPB)